MIIIPKQHITQKTCTKYSALHCLQVLTQNWFHSIETYLPPSDTEVIDLDKKFLRPSVHLEEPSVGPRPPLWSSGQSSWLQTRRSGFDSRHYQKKKAKVMGLERGPISFVSTIEELLERKSSGSGLENREYGRRDLSRWPRGTLYPQKLTFTSPTSGGRWVGIVRSRTQIMEFSLLCRSSSLARWFQSTPVSERSLGVTF
jgi:hypothetical protein